MKRKDGRKVSHEQLEWIRIQAVRAVVKDQRSPEEVIKTFGFHRSNIYKWLYQYEQKGWKGLKSSKSLGPKPILLDKEKKQLKKLLMKNPLQLHFDFGLWTLNMVRELIQKKFNHVVSIWTVSRVLEEIGYSKQKPLFRAYQQNPERVRLWMEKEYPKIRKEAKREKREVFFEDESGFSSTDHQGKTWALKGKTPVVRVTGRRYGTNSISAITSKGVLRFMLYQERFTTGLFVNFLRQLMVNQKHPVTLIVDGHPVHKGKKVQEYITSTKGKLKMYFLPPYSPELNPDEQVWNNVKAEIAKKVGKGAKEFTDRIRSKMHAIQKNVPLVQSFFRHPDVAYAM